MNFSDQRIQCMSKEEFAKLVRNETIDELTTWLQSCINQIDHSSAGDHEVYKACTAMVTAMQNKKTP